MRKKEKKTKTTRNGNNRNNMGKACTHSVKNAMNAEASDTMPVNVPTKERAKVEVRAREKGRGNSGREASAIGLPEKGKAKGRVWRDRGDTVAVRAKVRERETGQGKAVSLAGVPITRGNAQTRKEA
jgi:hypothetical protein